MTRVLGWNLRFFGKMLDDINCSNHNFDLMGAEKPMVKGL
jgi:hypothetical protein